MEDRIAAYLQTKLPAAEVRVSNLSRIPGGASRETWMFDATWDSEGGEQFQAFVIRIDPPASLLNTDREAEFAFYSSFWGTSVPVPRMRWLEPDGSILGGPFFVMDRVLGCDSSTRSPQLPPLLALQDRMAENMYGILAAIHTFDWRDSPAAAVAEAPAPEAVWSKELAHWEAIIDAEEISPQPIVRAGIRWLRANPPPPAQRISVVHGDYRVGNFLYQPDASIHAIVDWEMAHLGDPIEDLAYSFNESWQWANKDGRPGGIVERAKAIELWETASGLKADPVAVHWWDVFTNVKLQGIWVTGARSFQEGRSNELILASIGFHLTNGQDQALLRTIGRAP
jgi:aminoglycoside phosphotransferase (APT) family kinase protein